MVFSSVSFLVFFLPALLAVYYLVPRRFRRSRNFILLAGSLFFYGWGGPRFLLLLLISAAANYVCGLCAAPAAGRRQGARRTAVAAACVVGLGMLGVFKYAGFLARTLCDVGIPVPIPDIVLPIGISFFTFQGLSYVIDVYRGDAPVQKNPLNVALYIALFPQLVAGPIVRYATVSEAITLRRETLSDFSDGAVRFCFGLAKKMILANAMGEAADAVFAQNPASMPALLAWLGAAAYTFQIYFDFSAYSDMAIGLGKLFGFRFNENFNYPYVAKSVTDFWRRWHISLSSWFRDYVYIPLGGNRCSPAKHVRNIAAVWLLTGLWHGANWTFVLWGVWFLLLLLGEKHVWGRLLEKLPAAAGHIYTLLAAALSWVLFRSDTAGYAARYIAAMFGGSGVWSSGMVTYYFRLYLPQFVLCAAASLPVRDACRAFLARRNAQTALVWLPKLLAFAMLGLSYLKLVTGSFNPFIYFQF